jgi:hypothetical protein
MNTDAIIVEPLRLPASGVDVQALAGLLVDTVNSGAAVSFLAPLLGSRDGHAAGFSA